jgi:CRISPR-associated protein Csd2
MTPGADEHVPADIRDLYEIRDYRHAAAILSAEFPVEAAELFNALRAFRFKESWIVAGGGNESEIPKAVSKLLRPTWKEERLKAALVVNEVPVSTDTHKIDYVKGRIAFDLEWNSKDQTFDRDLVAFRAFYEFDRISVGVLLTRSSVLQSLFKKLGIAGKYGASTTHMSQLQRRLTAGRSGGCPVLALGITERLFLAGE